MITSLLLNTQLLDGNYRLLLEVKLEDLMVFILEKLHYQRIPKQLLEEISIL